MTRPELAVLPGHLQTEPGDPLAATIALRGAGAVPAAYTLAVEGLAGSWYTLAPDRLLAAPEAEAALILHPPLQAPRGIWPFTVVATPSDAHGDREQVEAILVVGPAPVAGRAASAGSGRHRAAIGGVALALLCCAAVALAVRATGQEPSAPAPRCVGGGCGGGSPTRMPVARRALLASPARVPGIALGPPHPPAGPHGCGPARSRPPQARCRRSERRPARRPP